MGHIVGTSGLGTGMDSLVGTGAEGNQTRPSHSRFRPYLTKLNTFLKLEKSNLGAKIILLLYLIGPFDKLR